MPWCEKDETAQNLKLTVLISNVIIVVASIEHHRADTVGPNPTSVSLDVALKRCAINYGAGAPHRVSRMTMDCLGTTAHRSRAEQDSHRCDSKHGNSLHRRTSEQGGVLR
jgi:hypothetical protein